MGINTTEYGTVLQKKLDQAIVQGLTSGWMDGNAGQVEYDGGNKVKIPEMTTSGLKKYDRKNGYPEGAVNLSFKEYTMGMDRGTGFTLDAMDVNENNFLPTTTRTCSVFQQEQVIPEIDAYRYSKLHALIAKKSRNTEYTVDETTVWKTLLADIAKVRDEIGDEIPLVISIRSSVKALLENSDKFTKVVHVAEFKSGEITTKLSAYNNCYFKSVPSSRMQTAYSFWDGDEDEGKNGGFKADAGAKNINWIIMPQNVPIAVTKQDKFKIIDPDTYQKADAWFVGYRRYHEIWLPEGRIKKCWTNAEAATTTEEGA